MVSLYGVRWDCLQPVDRLVCGGDWVLVSVRGEFEFEVIGVGVGVRAASLNSSVRVGIRHLR